MNEQQHLLLQKLDEFIRKFYKNQLVKGLIYTFTIVFLFFISIILFEYFGNFDDDLNDDDRNDGDDHDDDNNMQLLL